MNTKAALDTGQPVLPASGMYLTFVLDKEEYGLEILRVREIIGYMDITAVPQSPPQVKGVINLRGQVIPVVCLRTQFGMEETRIDNETCIIVAEITCDEKVFLTGIIVDRVSEVLDIAGSQIDEAPNFGHQVQTEYILGMAKIDDKVKILLDIDKILMGLELLTIEK
jgi:purine-binding chemotaxis protein CheW